MSSPLLTCPLCSQPGFETLDSLRYGLINAATRQIICPVCHDVLYGLDKFTIHLFSHAVQHQDTSSSVPVQRIQQPSILLNHQPNNLLICTQSHIATVTKHQPSIEDNLSNVQNFVTITNELTPKNVEHEDTSKNASFSCELLKSENLQTYNNIETIWEKKRTSNSICDDECSNRIKDVFIQDDHFEKIVQKSLPSDLKSINVSSTEKNKSTNDNAKYDSTNEINMTHQNISVHCSTSNQSSLNDKSPVKLFVKDIVKCDICGFTFDDSSILAIHTQLVHSTLCSKDTSNNRKECTKGGEQEKMSDEKRQFPCHLCSKAFKMRGSLMVHLRVAHSSIIGSGKSLLGKVDPDNHSEERKFGCHLCNKSFRKEQHLTQHLKTHEGKQWECDVCSKMFTTKYFLKKHKRLHTGETPYSCDTCGKTFTFQQSYHKHLLYHSDDKPHVCSECDRAFKELSTLHNHQRIHTGEKPFACETCGKCFRQRVSYLVHRRIHTGAMPYQCTACGKSFRYKVSQRTHKCPSQPPGTVVRQSGELVQKLLQGAQQSLQNTKYKVPSVESRAESKKIGDSTLSSESQLSSAPDDLCSFSTEDKSTKSSVSSTNSLEMKQLTSMVKDVEKSAITMNDKINAPSSTSSSRVEEMTGFENLPEKMTNLRSDNITANKKDLSQDSIFLNENVVHAASARGDKSDDNSDLIVETTDFFTMVMSPSGKSLPSPSERLKHLSLSSPVDTLLGYEDDESPDKNSETNTVNSQSDSVEIGTNNTVSVSDSEPLETINEESLKNLLYGSSSLTINHKWQH
ncbi:hypothetical protein L9F63_002051, partial [Diploptera punctata]